MSNTNNKLKKSEFITKVQEIVNTSTGKAFTKKDVEAFEKAIKEVVFECIENHTEFRLFDLTNIKYNLVPEREGYTALTGERKKYTVPEHYVVKFRPTSFTKEAVNKKK